MLLTHIKRICRSGVINFTRNGFISLASILVMVITLFSISSLLLLGVILNSSVKQIQSKVDVNVFLNLDANEDKIQTLITSVKGLPEVDEVVYINKEAALQSFKDKHQNDGLMMQALGELNTNPLSARFSVKAKDPTHYESVVNFLKKYVVSADNSNGIIAKINYDDNRPAIEKLNRIIEVIKRVGTYTGIFLIIVSILITFNTIRLAIYTSKDEIAVMRLVGASAKYIRGPFVVAGILYGMVSAFVSLIMLYPLTYWAGPYTIRLGTGVDLHQFFFEHLFTIILYMFLAGIVIGAASSFMAVRRYLKI